MFIAEGRALEKSRHHKEIVKAQLWIARKTLNRGEQAFNAHVHLYVITSHNIAHAGSKFSLNLQREFIHDIFEIIGASGLECLALYVLAIQVAIWSEEHHCSLEYTSISARSLRYLLLGIIGVRFLPPSSVLENILMLALKDLPLRLGVLSHSIGISAHVKNRATLILDSVSRLSSSDNDYFILIECLQLIVIQCSACEDEGVHPAALGARKLLSNL